ncbi:MAG: cysteine--tRNA ligase, partial [Planctomycetes bacterium]|nr:cysteine--tRNA ligase [Planctomycetota bacterium]
KGSYVSFDVIIRYLRYLDYRVRYVQNITDVGHLTDDADEGEDKVGLKAREMGVEPMEVAETFTRSYFEDMDALNIRRPDICPRASGHIPEQIGLVRDLLENGHAYQVDGNVYFDVMSFEDYGKLSGRDLDQMLENVRVDERAEKRSPLDFALWKKAEEGHLMNWESPWSVGYPGWHVECSAMGLKYLGPTLDIHGGGLENIFPHHENEIAQSEGATGEQFVRYWLHNNMVTVEGRKMGKSLGNFITLKDAFGGDPPLEEPVRPMVIRYFILNSHYRSPLDFSAEALEAAEKGLERIENAVAEVRKRRAMVQGADETVSDQIRQLVDETKERFEDEMNDDFNTAGAIGELSKYTHEVNRLMDEGSALSGAELATLDGLYSELGEQVLGILRDAGAPDTAAGGGLEKDLIETMIETRAALREAGQFDLADHIRDRLAGLGIVLKDEANGTEWKCE